MEKDSEQQAAKYDTSYEYGVDIKESRKRPRTKKHRPKIYDDSKPDPNLNSPKAPRTPKTPKTPNPLTPNRVQGKCRSSSKTPTTRKRALEFDVGDLSRTINDNQEANGQKYLHVYRRRFKARPNAICLDTPAFQFYMRRVEVNGRKDIIVYQRRYKKQRVENALSATKKVVDKKKKVAANVDLDNNSLRVWKRLVANGGEPVDEDKDEWWKRQGVKFGRRMDSFLEKMHLVQGDMRFSPWKGSVTDSVAGAYLTQNVTDHLSSSAFMSVAAKFPPEIRNKELSFYDVASSQESVASTSCPDESGTTEPVQVKFCGSSLYDSNGERILKKEKKKETKIDWDGLRKSYCGCGEEVNENYKDAVDWNAVRLCKVKKLANTIIERGMHNKLAKRIKVDFLARIYKDHGSLDLEWLRNVPPLKAKEFLLSFFGLGLKSVECIRLLTLHHLAFPVDTNVARVATRLGWVPLQSLPDDVPIHHLNAYPPLNNIQKYLFPRLCTLGKEKLYELHCHLITFGKVFCTKRKPNCRACPMKAECLHYASAFPRLAISESTESRENTSVTSIIRARNEPIIELPLSPAPEAKDTFPIIEDIEDLCNPHTPPSPSFYQDVNMGSNSYSQTYEPIVEVPPSPEPEANMGVPFIADIEDLVYESEDNDDGGGDYDGGDDGGADDGVDDDGADDGVDDDGVDDDGDHDDGDRDDGMSQALALSSLEEALDIRGPKKFSVKWRTMHLVYELPYDHPCLAGFEAREPEDPTPYLLSLWFPGEDRKSPEYLHNRTWILNKYNGEEEVQATVLIPCRTATRGSFPLNGTYFQVNEVFADNETSHVPLKVPRNQLVNLKIRILGCGTSTTSIHRALSTSAIQRLFCTGSICVRGFNRETRKPMPLHSKFHSTRRNSTSSTGLV